MTIISLLINIVVLVPICAGLFMNAEWVQQAYGDHSPARGILLSIYLAILLASVFLLFQGDPKFIAALLVVQIVYKLTTLFTVGTIKNPVVISNLLIAAFHSITVFTLWKAGKI